MPNIPSASPVTRPLRPSAFAAAAVVAGVACVGLAAQYPGVLVGSLSELLPGGPVDIAGQPVEELQAMPNPGLDQDGDGLPDAQEVVLGTLVEAVDSDGDGFGDGEEVARQSDPLDYQSVPMSGGISASLTARGEGDSLRLVISIHEPAGEIGDSKVRIGALTQQGVVSVPVGRFLGLADIYGSTGSVQSRVTVIDIPLSANFVHANGRVTFFLAAGNFLDLTYNAASVIDVESVDGVLLLLRPVGNNVLSAQNGGSIRQPIPPGAAPNIPPSWTPGAICYQRSVTVGGSGAIVIKQVIEANCMPGWDSYCASDCGSSVGSTFRTIDPLALVGG